MSTFKTKHYVDLSYTIKQFSKSGVHNLPTLNAFVDTLVFSLANDNRLFNERMFRDGCGQLINQDCILKPIVVNNEHGHMYNKRFI